MRLRYVALIVALIIVVNAGVTYGIVQWASPSGAQGPQGEQGIPGTVATADAKTLLCAAAIGALPPSNIRPNADVTAEIAKYCP